MIRCNRLTIPSGLAGRPDFPQIIIITMIAIIRTESQYHPILPSHQAHLPTANMLLLTYIYHVSTIYFTCRVPGNSGDTASPYSLVFVYHTKYTSMQNLFTSYHFICTAVSYNSLFRHLSHPIHNTVVHPIPSHPIPSNAHG